jgi:nucleotide-binding universal stress UspA family protein
MLAIHTILFPTDFSENAQQAFPLACALARDCGARIIVLYVIPPPVGHEEMEARHHPEDYYGPPREALHRIQALDQNVNVEHQLEEGDAAQAILDVARENQVNLIVMGTHGRTSMGRFLLGSVAEQVLRNAPCPVLTVKAPSPEEGTSQAKPSLTELKGPTGP